MPLTLLTTVRGLDYDYVPEVLVCVLKDDDLSRIQRTVGVIRSGALGPVEGLIGVELSGIAAERHPLEREMFRRFTGEGGTARDLTPASDFSKVLLFQGDQFYAEAGALSEHSLPDLDFSGECEVSFAHVRVTDEALYLIGFLSDNLQTQVVSPSIPLAELGMTRSPLTAPESL